MPLRSPKMNRFIFGFQRRVWWPKWTPASSSCFIETTAIVLLPSVDVTGAPRIEGRPWAHAGVECVCGSCAADPVVPGTGRSVYSAGRDVGTAGRGGAGGERGAGDEGEHAGPAAVGRSGRGHAGGGGQLGRRC